MVGSHTSEDRASSSAFRDRPDSIRRSIPGAEQSDAVHSFRLWKGGRPQDERIEDRKNATTWESRKEV